MRHKTLIVGSTLPALIYSYLNNIPFVFVDTPVFEFFDRLPLETPGLFFFSHFFLNKNINEVWKTPKGDKEVGLEKEKLWDVLYFVLSLSGLNLLDDTCAYIEIKENKVICLRKSGNVEYEVENIIIFDDYEIGGLPVPSLIKEEEYLVYDWFRLKKFKHIQYDFCETDDKFVKEVYFFTTNAPNKGCVSLSVLSAGQFYKEEYSDVEARFKIKHLLVDLGFKKDRMEIVENISREKIPVNKPIYQNTPMLTFLNTKTECDILNEHLNSEQISYAQKILRKMSQWT